MSSAVEVIRDRYDRQWVIGRTCQFMLSKRTFIDFFGDEAEEWNIDVYRRRSGKGVGDGNRAEIGDILAGRAMWSSWPPHLFRFVQKHIAEAMQREEFSAHEAISVVQAMNEIEAEVVEYKALERKLAKLTWHKV